MIGPYGKGGISIHDHSYGIDSVTVNCYLSFFNVVFSHRLSTIITVCRSPASLLLYASWSSRWPGVLLLAYIIKREDLWPSRISEDVPHLSLKEQSLTAMAMPYLCCFCGDVRVSSGGLLRCIWISRMMLGYPCVFYSPWDHFLYNCGRVFLWRNWKCLPHYFLNIMWLIRTCLQIIGEQYCQPRGDSL